MIKYLKKINYEGKNNGSYTIKGTQDEEETWKNAAERKTHFLISLNVQNFHLRDACSKEESRMEYNAGILKEQRTEVAKFMEEMPEMRPQIQDILDSVDRLSRPWWKTGMTAKMRWSVEKIKNNKF